MSNEKKHVSSSLERRLQAYPPPKYHGLVVAFATVNEMTEGQVVNMALRAYFDNIPENELRQIVNRSKNSY